MRSTRISWVIISHYDNYHQNYVHLTYDILYPWVILSNNIMIMHDHFRLAQLYILYTSLLLVYVPSTSNYNITIVPI